MADTYRIVLDADLGAVWDIDQSKLLQDLRLSLNFVPTGNDKYAFAVTYVNGDISPTFEDVEALLAGVKVSF